MIGPLWQRYWEQHWGFSSFGVAHGFQANLAASAGREHWPDELFRNTTLLQWEH